MSKRRKEELRAKRAAEGPQLDPEQILQGVIAEHAADPQKFMERTGLTDLALRVSHHAVDVCDEAAADNDKRLWRSEPGRGGAAVRGLFWRSRR